MPRPSTSQIPEQRLREYDRLVATQPDIERKGVTLPYTAVNGNMFSFLSPEGVLALRLSAADRGAFLDRYSATLHVAHGALMKEYVSVPEGLLGELEELRPWFAASAADAKGLKPKPSRARG